MPPSSFKLPQMATAAIVLAGLLATAPEPPRERIVAIGDIHGAYDQMVQILRSAELIDQDQDWAGGTSTLVQTGDFTDRGSGVRYAIELLMKIEKQAAEAGGKVHVLLGNHEVMNLIYDDRDVLVNPEIYASFADELSSQRREEAFEDWKKWRSVRQMRQRISQTTLEELPPDVARELTAFLTQDKEQWLAMHPLGLVEYRQAFAADGKYGRWMRELPVVVKLGETLFLHGGIGPEFEHLSLRQINELHRRRLEEWARDRKELEARRLVLPYFSWEETYVALRHQLDFPDSRKDREVAARAWNQLKALYDDLFSEGSPLWYRGYSRPAIGYGLDDERLAELLDRTDRAYGVRRTVAAHTPLAEHSILSRLDGRLFLIDTGMLSSVYMGRPSALEISLARVSPIYVDSTLYVASGTNGAEEEEEEEEAEERAVAPAGPRVFRGLDGQPLPFQELTEIERFLREATPLSKQPVGQGKTGALKIVLERGGTRAQAVFHSIDDVSGSPRKPVILDDGTKLIFFRDSYKGQVAVYELSKLMGMNNVPPAVVREIDGEEGSLALWIEQGTNLFDWRESGKEDPSNPYLNRQLHDMRLFDNLVDNSDRNSQNIFWTEGFDIWLIDHTRTFTPNRKLAKPDRVRKISRRLFEGLKGLDPDLTHERLGPYLGKFEIKAMLQRREQILELLEARIAELGEDEVIFEHREGPTVSYSEATD